MEEIRRRWRELGGSERPLVCLSVRSAFDLFLRVRELPQGSEVVISAITHPDMPRLLRAHGLVPVPVDIDPSTLAPTVSDVCAVLSSRTRAVLLTHLLGGSAPRDEIAALSAANGLELWEDCAQRFPNVQAANAGTAVAFYSFGPLKTATALLGAIADVQDPEVGARMLARQAEYPTYRRAELARRIGKMTLLAQLASHPPAYGALVRTAERLGFDPRGALRTASKSFGATTDLQGLRCRPSPATLRLLAHRLDLGTSHVLSKRAVADVLASEVGPIRVLGSASGSHHWLLVVDSEQSDLLQARLVANGFDALKGISNLEVVPVPDERPELRVTRAQAILRRAVVVPLHPDYSAEELERLVRCLRDVT